MMLWGIAGQRDRGRDARRRATARSPRPNSDTWGGNVDMRLTRDPKLALFKRDLPALLALHTERLAVRDLTRRVGRRTCPSFFTHAIEAESFRELVVDGFRGRQAQKTGSAIRLRRGEDVVVRDSRAAPDTDTFVEATEVTAGRSSPATTRAPSASRRRRRTAPAGERRTGPPGGASARPHFGRDRRCASPRSASAPGPSAAAGARSRTPTRSPRCTGRSTWACRFVDTAAGYGDGRSER